MQNNQEYDNIDYNNQQLQHLNKDFSKMNDDIIFMTNLIWFIGGILIGIYIITVSFYIYKYCKKKNKNKIEEIKVPLIKAVEILENKLDDIQITVDKLENKDN
jgi:beta-lactamase regulating signal transducer with metallopeptidase domain